MVNNKISKPLFYYPNKALYILWVAKNGLI